MKAEHLLYRNVTQFQGGLVSKAQRLLYHSTRGSGVINKKTWSPVARRALVLRTIRPSGELRPWCHRTQRFRGGLVFTAHRLLYHSRLERNKGEAQGLRVTKEKKKRRKTWSPVARRALVLRTIEPSGDWRPWCVSGRWFGMSAAGTSVCTCGMRLV